MTALDGASTSRAYWLVLAADDPNRRNWTPVASHRSLDAIPLRICRRPLVNSILALRPLSGEHPLQPDEAKAFKAYLRSRKHDSPVLFLSNRALPLPAVPKSVTLDPDMWILSKETSTKKVKRARGVRPTHEPGLSHRRK